MQSALFDDVNVLLGAEPAVESSSALKQCLLDAPAPWLQWSKCQLVSYA